MWRAALDAAVDQVTVQLAGRKGLGPADFREIIPVTRKHLMPLLAHLDTRGVTVRRGDGREVPSQSGTEPAGSGAAEVSES